MGWFIFSWARRNKIKRPYAQWPILGNANPFAIRFTNVSNVARNTQITSAPVTITGSNLPAPITVSGGSYSTDGSTFRTDSSVITSGMQVYARHTSSASFSTQTTTTITIGDTVGTFTSTTLAQDLVPNAFTFGSRIGVAVGSTQDSAAVAITGINDTVTFTVTNGTAQIDGSGSFLSTGTITSGQTLTVRHTASSSYSDAVVSTVTINGVSGTWGTITEPVPDTEPDPFDFGQVVGAPLNTVIPSGSIVVSGINASTAISIAGAGSPKYEKNNSGSWVSTAGTVVNGDSVRVRLTSSGSNDTQRIATLTIGGIDGAFGVTTLTADVDADPFTFTDQTGLTPGATVTSAAVSITGITASVPIAISGDASSQYSINGGPFVSGASTVQNNDSVVVKHTASSSFSTTVSSTLTVGSTGHQVSDTFSSTTAAQDTTPAAFTFTDQTNVALNYNAISNPITVSGINSPAAISISGAASSQYLIAGGSWTSAAGTVGNGEVVLVRHTASGSYSTATNTTLTIGGVSDTFTTTTIAIPSSNIYVDASAANDNGSGTSASPKKYITSGINLLTAGGTLIIRDGTYSNASDKITSIPTGARGTSGAWTTIRAENIGGVTITQALDLPPGSISYYTQFNGLRWAESGSKNTIEGKYLKFFNCGFRYGTNTLNNFGVQIGSNDSTYPSAEYVLLEDCWMYGYGGRYKVHFFAAKNCILRRCVARWDGHGPISAQPESHFNVYRSANIEIQNCIAIDYNPAFDSTYEAAFHVISESVGGEEPTNVYFRGCININNWSSGTNGGAAFKVDGHSPVGRIYFIDCASYKSQYGALMGTTFNAGGLYNCQRVTMVNVSNGDMVGEYASGAPITMTNCLGVAGTTGTSHSGLTYYSSLSTAKTAGLTYITGADYPSVLNPDATLTNLKGASIYNRIGTSGALYGEPGYNTDSGDSLWPYPNEALIKSDFAADRSADWAASAYTLTQWVWNRLGTNGPY